MIRVTLVSALISTVAIATQLPVSGETFKIAPIAIFHGIGSSCERNSNWNDAICNAVADSQPLCKCVEIGNGAKSSWFEKIDWQVSTGCRKLKSDPDFAGKQINIVGFSQGGLISRAIVERCNDLDVHTLFTYGAPHMGVAAVPDTDGHPWSHPLSWLAGYLSHYLISQKLVAPAGYYRSWWNLDRYLADTEFLPSVNNEKGLTYNLDYKNNLEKVINFGLWRWLADDTVIPASSEWFSTYDGDHNMVQLRQSELYTEDYIGLKNLDQAGKMFFYSGPGYHMYLDESYVTDYLVPLMADQTPTPSEY